MAITNFIPTIWSENLLTALDKKYIAVSHCNREYEGEIKNRGSVVKICGVGAIDVADYTKDTDMSTPQPLTDTVVELTIDQAKYFNFQIDDVDRTQCTPKIMDAAMSLAASAIANEADKYVFSLAKEAGTVITANITAYSLFDLLVKARQKLYENDVTDGEEVVLEVSPSIATAILNLKLDTSFYESNTIVDTGYLGSILGCKIYVSNNILKEYNGDFNTDTNYCMMRTKRAIAFAEQFSEIDAYRPEKRFADAVKGLHLYGAKVLYPSEIVTLALDVPCPQD